MVHLHVRDPLVNVRTPWFILTLPTFSYFVYFHVIWISRSKTLKGLGILTSVNASSSLGVKPTRTAPLWNKTRSQIPGVSQEMLAICPIVSGRNEFCIGMATVRHFNCTRRTAKKFTCERELTQQVFQVGSCLIWHCTQKQKCASARSGVRCSGCRCFVAMDGNKEQSYPFGSVSFQMPPGLRPCTSQVVMHPCSCQ